MPSVQPLTQTYLREDTDFIVAEILNALLPPYCDEVIRKNRPQEVKAPAIAQILRLLPQADENAAELFNKGFDELCKPNDLQVLEQDWLEKECMPNPSTPQRESNWIKVDPFDHLTALISHLFENYHVRSLGQRYYPYMGFDGWQSGHEMPFECLYVNYTPEVNKSFFRYYEDGKIITDWDSEKIIIRRFKCPQEQPYFWHCVGSETDLLSYGFRLFPKKL